MAAIFVGERDDEKAVLRIFRITQARGDLLLNAIDDLLVERLVVSLEIRSLFGRRGADERGGVESHGDRGEREPGSGRAELSGGDHGAFVYPRGAQALASRLKGLYRGCERGRAWLCAAWVRQSRRSSRLV